MKKVIVIAASLIFCFAAANAQDMAKATELAKSANEAWTEKNFDAALEGFKSALAEAEAAGEEGAELVATCKNAIPNIVMSQAKALVNSADYTAAIAKFGEVKEAAAKYGADDLIGEVESLLPKVLLSQGNNLLQGKDFAGATEVFTNLTSIDPENGVAFLRLGQCLNATGKADEAVAAFKSAAEKGQDKLANSQLANIYLKKASADLKTKNYAAAVEDALECNNYKETPQAYQIAGQASQIAGKAADAVKYFEKYLELAPNAANAGAISYTVGALYQTSLKNNAKAKEFYQKASTDPKFGAEAKKMLDALK